MQTIIEIADTERVFRKSIQRVFEKHGYNKKPTPIGSLVDCLASLESPTTKTAWDSVLAALNSLYLSHVIVIDSLGGPSVVALEKLTKSIDTLKQELSDCM